MPQKKRKEKVRGSHGGRSTFKKYGRDHMSKIAKLMWKKIKANRK